jgi:hypothetical protein
MEIEKKSEKVNDEKEPLFKKDVMFTAKIEAVVHVRKEGSYNFQWGIKNIIGDELRETFMLLLLESICQEYEYGADKIMTSGTHEQKLNIKRDEAMFKSLVLARINSQERRTNFLMVAATKAIEKKIKGPAIQIVKPTPSEKSKFEK